MNTMYQLSLALAFFCASAAQATEMKSGDFLAAYPLDPQALAPERAGTVTALSLSEHAGCKLIVLTAVAEAEPSGVRLEPVRMACNTANYAGTISVSEQVGTLVVTNSSEANLNARLQFVVIDGFNLPGSTQSNIDGL